MKMKLPKLEDNDKKVKMLRLEEQQLPENWEGIEYVLYYPDFP